MKNPQRLLKWMVPILIAPVVFWLSADSPKRLAKPVYHRVKSVPATVVEKASVSRRLSFPGVLRSAHRATLAFSVSGRLLSREVQIGDHVEKGQVVARIDERPFGNAEAAARSALAELSARRNQAQRDLERVRELVKTGAATKEELEKVTAGAESLSAARASAEAQLREAERQSGETVLRAPFAGSVTEVMLEPGEYAGAGRGVVSISGKDALEMEVEVQESVLPLLQPGKEVTMILPFSENREIKGAIRSLGQSSAGPGRLFPVLITVEGGKDLVSGMTAELWLDLVSHEETLVPVSSVINPGGNRPTVFRVREGAIEKVPVEVGRLVAGKVTARGGLREGDLIVTGNFSGLMEGTAVEVIR